MEIEDAMGMKFKVNLLRLLVFFCEGHGVSVVEVVYFDDTWTYIHVVPRR